MEQSRARAATASPALRAVERGVGSCSPTRAALEAADCTSGRLQIPSLILVLRFPCSYISRPVGFGVISSCISQEFHFFRVRRQQVSKGDRVTWISSNGLLSSQDRMIYLRESEVESCACFRIELPAASTEVARKNGYRCKIFLFCLAHKDVGVNLRGCFLSGDR